MLAKINVQIQHVAVLLTLLVDILPGLVRYTAAVFPCLSLTGMGVLAIRQDHARRLAAIAQDKAERREARLAARSERVQNTVLNVQDGVLNSALASRNAQRAAEKTAAIDSMLVYLSNNPGASLADIGAHIGRSKGTVSNYVGELEATGAIRHNGHGLEVVG